MLIFPTYQTLLTKPAATSSSSSSSSFGGVTTDLDVHYDFSDTSCWNRNKSSNAADYTVNNLAGDHNDGLFRRKVSGTTYTNTSDIDTIDFDSDADGCIEVKSSNYSGSSETTVLLIPGHETSTSTSALNYNAPTITDSNNLLNIGTGAYTIEYWIKFYLDNSNHGSVAFFKFYNKTTSNSNSDIIMLTYDLNWVSHSIRGDLILKPHHTTTTRIIDAPSESFPGQPSSGAGWTDWMHIVVSKESGTSSGNLKAYVNNTLELTTTGSKNYDYMRYGRILAVYNSSSPDYRIGIFRFYQDKALTSSEVTTNWNDQKSRFGH